ncbi:hypothetical protein F383_25822 [Gossypium arboreum]|uniref:Uncharacterized protein n=1 Tax=Gossypium arboreum TaxID=29729 RepID=A0A0B0MNU9_GOSAR|nr:hypothetical protein F383_25822 [Gossypium arboreum]
MQHPRRGLTRTHKSSSHINTNVLNLVLLTQIYQKHLSMPTY